MPANLVPIGVLNGPNLSRLGQREPEIYGEQSLADLEALIAGEAKGLGVTVRFYQSNCEGALMNTLAAWTDDGVMGLIINAGALTHTSLALRDAITATALPAVEVHISNIYQREPFRHQSLTAGACRGVITGLGFEGYLAALRFLRQCLK